LRVPENFVFYLSAHRGCNDHLLAEAKKMNAEYVELSSDPKAVLIRRMVFSVQAEVHRMRGFVRLKALGYRILYGYLKPEHRIGDWICDHFAKRSPSTIIALGNSSQSWVSLYHNGSMQKSRGAGIEDTIKAFQSAMGAMPGDQGIERIWETYYASQYCPERRNLQSFNHRMPKKALSSAGLAIERNENGCTLNDFFKQE
jgi:probable DNA metabolism protein